MKKLRITLLAVLLALLAGCSRQERKGQVEAASKGPEPLAIRTAVAQTRRVEKAISVTGSLQPDDVTSLSSEVSGRIASLHADFGQAVRKGDVIVELDKTEFQIQMERAKASLAQALARVGLDPGQEEIRPDSSPAIRQALAQYEDAHFKFENAQKLVKSGDISQERFTELEKAYLARKAALEAARDDLRTQLANIAALRAEVKLAQKRLNDATVRAPFDGAVSQRMVSPGQYVKENTQMLTVVKTYPLRLRVEIPESAAMTVRTGTTLSFTTDAAAGIEFHAIVKELNPSLEAKSRSLTAEARLAENDARLRPGMFVQVRLVTARDAMAVVVPKEAIYNVAGLTKVFVLRGDRAVERRVPPGQEFDGWVEVPADMVQAGDRVAVSDQASLIDGALVRIKG